MTGNFLAENTATDAMQNCIVGGYFGQHFIVACNGLLQWIVS